MNEIILEGIINLSLFPISYIVLKLIFKKSIMVKLGLITICFILFVAFMSFFQGIVGIKKTFWIFPLNIVIGTFLFLYINKFLRKPLHQAITKIKLLAKGEIYNQNIKGKSQQDELGILNDSIIDLSYMLKVALTKIKNNSENFVITSQQLKNSTERLSQGSQ